MAGCGAVRAFSLFRSVSNPNQLCCQHLNVAMYSSCVGEEGEARSRQASRVLREEVCVWHVVMPQPEHLSIERLLEQLHSLAEKVQR